MNGLRAYQRAALDALPPYWANGGDNPLIVCPTGAGKSVILATFVREALEAWPKTRIVSVTHVKELIAQNHAALLRWWPEAPTGIYSAGLNQRNTSARVLFCGIQSVHKRTRQIGFADLLIVDEAHLIPKTANTMYGRFIAGLREINPGMKVVGLTATPYRLDSGELHKGEGAIFDGIAYDIEISKLIDEGFLSRPVSKSTAAGFDLRGVGTRGGEYIPGQLEAAVNREDVNRACVAETINRGRDRRSWLVFAAGVAHAEALAAEFNAQGVAADCVFGHTPHGVRSLLLRRFKAGELRAIVNVGVLTTGFDAPSVDLIALMRPTKSPGLYVQMVGRGTRIAPGKENCLVLDFAGNGMRLGPIDDVKIKASDESGEPGEAPQKVCPECDSLVPTASRECPDCGYQFPEPEEPELDDKPAEAPMLRRDLDAPQWVGCDGISAHPHLKASGGIPTLRVEYRCGLTDFREWVCFDHDGFARQKAEEWWRQMGGQEPPPDNVGEALSRFGFGEIEPPAGIKVKRDGKYWSVVGRTKVKRSVAA